MNLFLFLFHDLLKLLLFHLKLLDLLLKLINFFMGQILNILILFNLFLLLLDGFLLAAQLVIEVFVLIL